MAPDTLSVQTFEFLRGIIDVVVASLHLIAKRKVIEQACSDYILQDTYSI